MYLLRHTTKVHCSLLIWPHKSRSNLKQINGTSPFFVTVEESEIVQPLLSNGGLKIGFTLHSTVNTYSVVEVVTGTVRYNNNK